MSRNQWDARRRTADGGKSKNNMSTPQWGGHNYWQKVADDPTTLGLRNFTETALSRTISKIIGFSPEIQDGCQKWWENIFGEKIAVDTLEVKIFVEIILALFPR